ncbi:MAG: hypothetical protein IIX79_06620, partial [Alistipes sp.]|nr:hypothetical protein [Alistipes sp.]
EKRSLLKVNEHFSDKQSGKDCPFSQKIICCQSGTNLPPIKILGWMGHTIMYFPFSPMIEVAKERYYPNEFVVRRGEIWRFVAG